MSIVKAIFGRFFSGTDNVVGNSDDVLHAILENVDGDQRYVTEFGEPQLVDRGGDFSEDYKVQIPTKTAKGDPSPPNIEYDLPDAQMGDTASELFKLLDHFGIDEVSDLGKLEGKNVDASFEKGVLSFKFDEGKAPKKTNKDSK